MANHISFIFEIALAITCVSCRNIVTTGNCTQRWFNSPLNDQIMAASETVPQTEIGNSIFVLPTKNIESTEANEIKQTSEETQENFKNQTGVRELRDIRGDRGYVQDPELFELFGRLNITIMKRDIHENANDLHGNETMHTNEQKDEPKNYQRRQKRNAGEYGKRKDMNDMHGNETTYTNQRRNEATNHQRSQNRNTEEYTKPRNLDKRDTYSVIDKNILVEESVGNEQVIQGVNDEDSKGIYVTDWLLINKKDNDEKSNEENDHEDKNWILIREKGPRIVNQNVFVEPISERSFLIIEETEAKELTTISERSNYENEIKDANSILEDNVNINDNILPINATKEEINHTINSTGGFTENNEEDGYARKEKQLSNQVGEKPNMNKDVPTFETNLHKSNPNDLTKFEEEGKEKELLKNWLIEECRRYLQTIDYEHQKKLYGRANNNTYGGKNVVRELNKKIKSIEETREDSSLKTNVRRSAEEPKWSKFDPDFKNHPQRTLSMEQNSKENNGFGVGYPYERSGLEPNLQKYSVYNLVENDGQFYAVIPKEEVLRYNKVLAKRAIILEEQTTRNANKAKRSIDSREAEGSIFPPTTFRLQKKRKIDDIVDDLETIVDKEIVDENISSDDDPESSGLDSNDDDISADDESRLDEQAVIMKMLLKAGFDEDDLNRQYGLDDDEDVGIIDAFADLLGNDTVTSHSTQIINETEHSPITSNNNLTKMIIVDAKIGHPTNTFASTKFGYVPGFNPAQIFKPINDKIQYISQYLTHPNNGFSFLKPADIWSKIQQTGANVFSNANGAIFGLGQVGGHDYPFPYRRSLGRSNVDLSAPNEKTFENRYSIQNDEMNQRGYERKSRSIAKDVLNPAFDKIEDLRNLLKQEIRSQTLGTDSNRIIGFLKQLKSNLDSNPEATAIGRNIDKTIAIFDQIKDRLGRSLHDLPMNAAEKDSIAGLKQNLDALKELGDNIDEEIEFINDFEALISEERALNDLPQTANLLKDKLREYKEAYQINKYELVPKNFSALAYQFPFLFNPKEIQQFVENVTASIAPTTTKPETMSDNMVNGTTVTNLNTKNGEEITDNLPTIIAN